MNTIETMDLFFKTFRMGTEERLRHLYQVLEFGRVGVYYTHEFCVAPGQQSDRFELRAEPDRLEDGAWRFDHNQASFSTHNPDHLLAFAEQLTKWGQQVAELKAKADGFDTSDLPVLQQQFKDAVAEQLKATGEEELSVEEIKQVVLTVWGTEWALEELERLALGLFSGCMMQLKRMSLFSCIMPRNAPL
jgi:uncharacterized protein YndB with AHSA1/START domain